MGHRGDVRYLGDVRHHHHALDGGQLLHDLRDARQRVDHLAVVEVAVAAEQHPGLHLPEAVHHALHAEVRGARRERRAQARGGEHRDDALRHVGHEGGHAVAFAHARRDERLPHARHLVVQLAVGEPAAHALLAPEDHRLGVVAAAQQVLREVEPRAGEEARAGHPVAIGEHGLAAGLGDHAAEVPHRDPEFLEMLDGPPVERGVVAQPHAVAPAHQFHERRDVGVPDAFRRRAPERLLVHRRAPQSSAPPAARTSSAWAAAAAMPASMPRTMVARAMDAVPPLSRTCSSA
jgi:hypothetical protein